ncbi:AbrB family transcriptional regulator [Dongia sp.]|uniref:AbrB family transcriptional regulator n=1 Tax=Dongia sp. TaxID=1977262 RepID=UPI0035B186E9
MAQPDRPSEDKTSRRKLRALLPSIAAGLVIGALGSIGARQIGLPLPNLLGPLILCAIVTLAGITLTPLPGGREIGQVVVGLAIGLRLLPEVLQTILGLLPAMILATIGVVIVTMAAGLLLRHMTGIDRATAYFATAPVGLAEMASLAHARGGAADITSLVHTIRVSAMVTAVPLLVTWFGRDGGIITHHVGHRGEWVDLILLMAISAAAAFFLKRLRLPNAWLLIPIIIGALAAATGLTSVGMPSPLLVVAQVVIGIWLGCRFRRAMLTKLPRVTIAACLTTLLLLIAAAAGAALLASLTDVSFETSFLSLAPGGVTEMVLTASILHLDVPVISAFHLVRILLLTSFSLVLFRVFEAMSRRLDGTAQS